MSSHHSAVEWWSDTYFPLFKYSNRAWSNNNYLYLKAFSANITSNYSNASGTGLQNLSLSQKEQFTIGVTGHNLLFASTVYNTALSRRALTQNTARQISPRTISRSAAKISKGPKRLAGESNQSSQTTGQMKPLANRVPGAYKYLVGLVTWHMMLNQSCAEHLWIFKYICHGTIPYQTLMNINKALANHKRFILLSRETVSVVG